MTNKQFLKKNKWILKHWKTYRQMTQEFEIVLENSIISEGSLKRVISVYHQK